MEYLLDTHTVLWHATNDKRLSATAIDITESDHTLWLSYVSIWKMAIKVQRGRLELHAPLDVFVDDIVTKNKYNLLEIKETHLYPIASLPYYHKDPFDRLIIAQGMVEGITIVTDDQAFQRYEVRMLW